ncbi:hypothetical protein [Alloalcanivorax xenomutans]|uniref:hypothetical protein n=1 Tax=Alloalcanivorax xenomutans TaxID=1094342 RepID=UPI003C64BC2D
MSDQNGNHDVRPGRQRGRKPVSLTHATQGVLSTQDAVWQVVRGFEGEFAHRDVCRAAQAVMRTGVNDDTVRSYLRRLEKGGYLDSRDQKTSVSGRQLKGAATQRLYRLIKDTGIDTPRLTRDGQPVTQGQGQEAMWQTLRILGECNARELAQTANTGRVAVSVPDARHYLKNLYACGYLVMTERNNGSHSLARYRLLPSRNTGPKAPQVRRIKAVFDANTGETHVPRRHVTGEDE